MQHLTRRPRFPMILLALASLAGTAMAQSHMGHGQMPMAAGQTPMAQGAMATNAMPAMTDAEVRKIDKEAGKITLRHGEIKHMDMPPMTMVFTVRDKALLDKVSVGNKVRFHVVSENGLMVVTDLQPAP